MKKDRFFEEMDKAYKEANPIDNRKEKYRDFIVENNNSYYEVDCRKYKEIMKNR